MTTHARYVEIPADRLAAHLEAIGQKVAARWVAYDWTTSGRERVFVLNPHTPANAQGPRGIVWVYTSAAVGAATARDCGKDAVRVVVGVLDDADRFRPTEKSQKILRTAPKGAPDRVAAFLDRLQEALRGAYARAHAVRPCPRCGGPLVYREGRNGPFLGCLAYPACKATAPVAA